jgi:hypothetical protein
MKNTLSAFALGIAGALVGLTVATAPVEAATGGQVYQAQCTFEKEIHVPIDSRTSRNEIKSVSAPCTVTMKGSNSITVSSQNNQFTFMKGHRRGMVTFINHQTHDRQDAWDFAYDPKNCAMRFNNPSVTSIVTVRGTCF